MENNRINIEVCGLPLRIFAPFFAVVIAAVYFGFIPTTTLADGLTASTFVGTTAFLMAIGGLLFWLGSTIPIVSNFLGGACLLPLIGASFLKYAGLVPEVLVNGTRVLIAGGFQDAYIAMLLVGSILMMNRSNLLHATTRYVPTIIGSQFFAIGLVMLAGRIIGFGPQKALFEIAAPCMSGGSVGALTTLPKLYSDLSGTDMTTEAGKFLCYASISNVLAIILTSVFNSITKSNRVINGGGQILRRNTQNNMTPEKIQERNTDYKVLGSGIFMAFSFYLLGNILGNLPGFNAIPGLAWTIIFVVIIKCTGIFPQKYEYNCVCAMNFALEALLPMLIAGIGINSLEFSSLTEYFTPGAFAIIITAVLGAFLGACLFGHLFGLYAYEAGITAGLCSCSIGSSGNLAVLSAANRMNLLAFASISTRIGGALMVIWIGILYRMLC